MADRSLRRKIDATDAQIQAFVTRLDSFLYRTLNKTLSGLKAGDQASLEAAQRLGSLFSVLRDAGLQDQLSRLDHIYAGQLQDIKDVFDKIKNPITYSDVDRDVIQSIIDFDTSKVFNRVSGYVDDVRTTLMRGVIAGDVPDFTDVHDEFSPGLQGNLESELTTAFSGFSRTVTASKADGAGITLFEYAGPDDKITREFCRQVLEGQYPGLERQVPIYSVEEINIMQNDQIDPVIIYAGGYDCRHDWLPITEEDAVAAGWNGGE
jgi:hypothetical protein